MRSVRTGLEIRVVSPEFRLALQALAYRDFPVILAFITVIAFLVTGLNLLVDIPYGWLDPRIRIQA